MKRDRKLLHRMVFSYTLVFSVIFFLIMGLLYVVLAAGNREQASLNHQVLVGQPLKQLDRFLDEMDNVAYKAMTNDVLIRKLTGLRLDDSPDNYFDHNILDNIDTATVVAAQNARVSPVRRIIVYNDRGDFISSGAMVDSAAVGGVLRERDAAGLMELFRSGECDYRISPPQKDEWMSFFTGDYFTLTRPVMNVYSRDVVGIVEVQHDKRILEEYLRFSSGAALAVDIYDESGSPVLSGRRPGDVVVATATSDTYGWKIELLEPAGVLRTRQLQLLGIMVLTWLVLDLAVFVIIRLISLRISRPLMELTAEVEAIRPGAPGRVQVERSGIAEITALEGAFNGMLERLTLSMDQEKKSFLLAMQAQMNPHFLYNVLSVVNAMAIEDRSDVVVRICGNMSAMLRYASSYVTGTATVAEELEHTVAYLELMKCRYDYMFTYEVALEPGLADITIPKLVVQPLCENCFTHAFADIEPPYRIGIRISGSPERWNIRVEDNGSGFDEPLRRTIVERANNASYEDLNKLRIGGLGLVSSVVRLGLITGMHITCGITPLPAGGSAVEITVEREGETR